MKEYRQGCVLGRFSPLHIGHVHVIEQAIAKCDRVLVFVGSSQEQRTSRNPFSYKEREAMLRAVFGNAIDVAPLPDLGLGDVPAWGDHLLEEAKRLGHPVDAFILGNEMKNDKWFSPKARESIALVEVSRTGIPVSATDVRQALMEGDEAAFQAKTPKELHPHYEEFRAILRASK